MRLHCWGYATVHDLTVGEHQYMIVRIDTGNAFEPQTVNVAEVESSNPTEIMLPFTIAADAPTVEVTEVTAAFTDEVTPTSTDEITPTSEVTPSTAVTLSKTSTATVPAITPTTAVTPTLPTTPTANQSRRLLQQPNLARRLQQLPNLQPRPPRRGPAPDRSRAPMERA